MNQPNLAPKIKNLLDNFIKQLKGIYENELVSIILYGSAASGEFVDRHSDLNLLIVLEDADLPVLAKASGLLNRRNFKPIRPLFFTEEYIRNSSDVFPIEFFDMKENYCVLWGKDVLEDISIDAKNLRFQCEQELKGKLLNLRQLYLRHNKDKMLLKNILFKSFTSILHILRNVIRIKAKHAPYLKQDIIRDIASEFKINSGIWAQILSGRTKQIRISSVEIDKLFVNFTRDLQKITNAVDNF